MTHQEIEADEPFVFRTRLSPNPGVSAAYVEFHRAIPKELDNVMRAAGVLTWRIYLRRDVLTHVVEAKDRSRLKVELDQNPVNVAWQRQVAPYLAGGEEPEEDERRGTLIWDFSWPTR